MKTTIGLRERIRDAADLSEIDALNQEAASYSDASAKTRRRWASTADRRIAELHKVAAATADRKQADRQK